MPSGLVVWNTSSYKIAIRCIIGEVRSEPLSTRSSRRVVSEFSRRWRNNNMPRDLPCHLYYKLYTTNKYQPVAPGMFKAKDLPCNTISRK